MSKKPQHYVDNGKFLAELKVYRQSVLDHKQALKEYKSALKAHKINSKTSKKPIPPPSPPDEAPRITEYLGECFLKIATHLSYKPNFVNYTFRDDMISDGVENCLVYINNFDPDKSSNPFGYFTQIIFFAFVRRIEREKKHTYIKYKMIEQSVIDGDQQLDGASNQVSHPDGAPSATGRTMLQFDNVKDFINRFEVKTSTRKARRRQMKADKDAGEVETVDVE